MRLALAAGGVLLLALLTWLLLHGIDTRSSAYAEIQRAFDNFALAEASIGRDVLRARAGLLGNYDILVEDEHATENALGRIRLHMAAEKLDPKPVDRLAESVTEYGKLIERFKTDNALLRNSLSYVGQLSTDPSSSALGGQLAPSVTALASGVLRLAGNPSPESSSSLQEQIKRFEAQAPTDGQDAEAVHALVAHARLLSNLLPEVDQTLRAFAATPGRQALDQARQVLADAQANFESTAQRFRVLLYITSLGLLVIALRLGLRLWTRTLRIRRLVDANIIGIFMFDDEGNIIEVNETFLNIVGYDRKDLKSGRLRWADLTPAEGHDHGERCSLPQPKLTGSLQPIEKGYIRKDGSRVPVLVGAATFEDRGKEGVAFVLDLTERKRADERLRVQHTVAQILAEGATIEEATPRILRAIGESLGWDVGVLWRVDREAEALRCVEFWHNTSIEVPEFERLSRKLTFGPGLGLPGRVWSGVEPEYISDVVHDENFPRVSIAEREGLHAAFGFPILLGGEVLGVIEFFSREIRQPDRELLNMLATIGSQIGQFIERKRAEEALHRSEAWLVQAQRLSHTGNWVINGTTRRFLYWSDESYRIWGFDPLRGLPSREDFWGRIHPDDRERVWGEVQEALREQRDLFAEFRILLPDGTVKHLEANTHHEFSPTGALLEVVCTSIDVTERKRAEQALRKSEAKFRDYAETASDWFWEIGPDYKFTLLTENAFGADAANRIGTACWDHALDLETEPEKWRSVWATLDARKPFRDFVYCSADRNGSPMYVKASGKPVFDINGEFRGYRGTGTDVTAIIHAQQVEASLQTVQAELTRVGRVSTLGQLTASIAHEVTQPIASARNNTRAALNFLDRQPSNMGEVKEALECAIADADRAGQIIDRIRDHIKKAPPRKDRFDLNKAINEVLLLARSAIADNDVSVQTRFTAGSLPVRVDRVQVQQVVLNLILNAIEAMGSSSGPRELLISTERDHKGVLVAVGDSGPGIGPENLERVFDAFYTTKHNGVGMGLSICQSIIKAHGGRLWGVVNKPRGAVFQFTLPSTKNS